MSRPCSPPSTSASIARWLVAAGLAVAAGVLGCRGDLRAPPIGSPRETLSDVDHGAAAAAVDAMDLLSADPEPDTEVHLRLSVTHPATPDDSTRADLLLVTMRGALRKYADVRVAAADGFEETPATAGKHSTHHLTNWAWARAESHRFDPTRPTSLLYGETADGTLQLVGAMYTAPASATAAELDQRIPVGLARWHQHVNWCAPKAETGLRWLEVRNGSPLYGPRSPVATPEACDQAGGVFRSRVFGWMVHVTLIGSDDPSVVWGGNALPRMTPEPGSGVDSTTLAAVAAAPASASSSVRPAASEPLPPAAPNSVRSPASVPAPSPAPPTPRARIAARVASGASSRFGASATTAPLTSAIVPAPSTPAAPRPLASGPPPKSEFTVGRSTTGSYQSATQSISYERFLPPGAGRHPAILLLHDGQGPAAQSGPFEDAAAALNRRGYVVEVVQYFDRTGTTSAQADDRRLHFRQWSQTVADALSDLEHTPQVDPERLGVLGVGLGATLALTVAAEDARIKAVADYSGTLPARAAPFVRRMPAVLIAHGDRDEVVPIADAYRLRSICQGVHAPVEMDVMYGVGHVVQGADAEDRQRKTVAFFDRYVRGTE